MPDLPPPGLSRPTTTPVPDEIFDVWLPHLSEAELKVLLYICRRTLGFKKDIDPIALSQLTHGIVRKDGRRLDSGAGVSESSVVRAVKGLLAKGLIIKENQTSANGGHDTTYYGLNWHGLAPSLHDDRRGAVGTVNLTDTLLAPQKEQESDVQHTDNKNGSDPVLIAAIRTWAYQHKARVTEPQIAALARAAGTLARWQAVSADARSLQDVHTRLGEG